MNIRLHSFRLSWYDHVCLGLLSLTAVGCIAITLLARVAGIDLFGTASKDDFNALYSSIFVAGLLCTGFVSIILLLLRERRRPGNDRRQSRQTIDFPDRRSGIPRRCAAPQTSHAPASQINETDG